MEWENYKALKFYIIFFLWTKHLPLISAAPSNLLWIRSWNWIETHLLSNHALAFALLMHTIFTTLKNIIEITEMLQEGSNVMVENVRKFTCDWKKEFAFWTCGRSENTPSSKTNHDHTKIYWPHPFLPPCGLQK